MLGKRSVFSSSPSNSSNLKITLKNDDDNNNNSNDAAAAFREMSKTLARPAIRPMKSNGVVGDQASLSATAAATTSAPASVGPRNGAASDSISPALMSAFKLGASVATTKGTATVAENIVANPKRPSLRHRRRVSKSLSPNFFGREDRAESPTPLPVKTLPLPNRKRPAPVTKRLSLESKTTFDPFQVFEVHHKKALILEAKVIRGRGITKGSWYADKLDTPDPYLILHIKSGPNTQKRTSIKDNQINPEWNEKFVFYLDDADENILNLTLMDSNSVFPDEVLGHASLDIAELKVGASEVRAFPFDQQCAVSTSKSQGNQAVNGSFSKSFKSVVEIEFSANYSRDPALRYSLTLCDEEKKFLRKRKLRVKSAIEKFLGLEDLEMKSLPNIAIMGSGGGFRAMVAFTGVLKALCSTGIMDCATYLAGLSGSSWTLSSLYSHQKWPSNDVSEFQDEMKDRIQYSPFRFLNPTSVYRLINDALEKRRRGQPVSFTDVFGRMIGETLMPDELESTLSGQRRKFEDGQAPMPLYACLNVKEQESALIFSEWVEFSPFEIGMPKYGTFKKSELFGSKLFMGEVVNKYPEQPLYNLMGIWGSAFSILIKRVMEQDKSEVTMTEVRAEMEQYTKEQLLPNEDIDHDDDEDDEVSQASTLALLYRKRQSEFLQEGALKNLMGASLSAAFAANANLKVGLEKEPAADKTEPAVEAMKSVDSDTQITGVFAKQNFADIVTAVALFDAKPAEKKYPKRNSRKKRRLEQNQQQYKRPSSAPEMKTTSSTMALFSGASISASYCGSTKAVESTSPTSNASKSQPDSNGDSGTGTSTPSYWKVIMESLTSLPIFASRHGRAGMIHNPLRGLTLNKVYPFSPFTPRKEQENPFTFTKEPERKEFEESIFVPTPTTQKKLYMVDAGLAFNSPYPLVLRGQRGIDIILSFDFSRRPKEEGPIFKELKLAEKWARVNNVPFPPIDETIVDREGLKPVYVFRHPTDEYCPVILHFVLLNSSFKAFKSPGVHRDFSDSEDMARGNFSLFEGPQAADFSTFNFQYSRLAFERLAGLTEYNTLCCVDVIKSEISSAIRARQRSPRRISRQLMTEDVDAFAKRWRLSRQKSHELEKFIQEEKWAVKTEDSYVS